MLVGDKLPKHRYSRQDLALAAVNIKEFPTRISPQGAQALRVRGERPDRRDNLLDLWAYDDQILAIDIVDVEAEFVRADDGDFAQPCLDNTACREAVELARAKNKGSIGRHDHVDTPIEVFEERRQLRSVESEAMSGRTKIEYSGIEAPNDMEAIVDF